MPFPLFQKTAKLVIISKMFLYKVFIVFFFNFLCTCPYILSFFGTLDGGWRLPILSLPLDDKLQA